MLNAAQIRNYWNLNSALQSKAINVLRIVHITEALGGGIAHSLSQMAQAQSADGMRVIVAHSLRADTPSVAERRKLFPAPIEMIVLPMVTPIAPLRDLASLCAIVGLIGKFQPDIIHLHSSKAGVLGRIASRLRSRQSHTLYSPHGFSFLRQDVSTTTRKLYIGLEKMASFFGGTLVACSASEFQCAMDALAIRNVALVDNCVDTAEVVPANFSDSRRVRVVTSGRLCYQKAPWRFKQLAMGCSSRNVDFVWIGGGEMHQELQVDGSLPANLVVTGWMERAYVLDEIAQSDIFTLTSLWEGMPLSLIEAQVAGLPAVVSDVVGSRDVVKDGVTGFVCRSDGELATRLHLLIDDPDLRRKMGRKAREIGLERFSVSRMHREMLAVYGVSKQIRSP